MDETELRQFLHEDYPRLVGAVALFTGDLATAEDAVQEAVARAWERTERGQPIASLDRWVAAVAMNLSRSRLRHLRVERRARHLLVQPASVAAPNADAVDIRSALQDLPQRQREVVVLRYYLDLDTAQVAEAMGTSAGTVKSQLAKARRHLADVLSIPDGDEEQWHADV